MAARMSLEDRHQGISPDQARADYLAWRLEEIRSAISMPTVSIQQLRAALQRARGVLDRIPPQF